MASDGTRTLKDLVEAATRGDARAQFELGRRHFHGDGTPQDLSLAARWFGSAAEQGHVVARIYLTELVGEEASMAQVPDGGFDRWLRGAVDGLRRAETRRREERDAQEAVRLARRQRRRTVPALVAAMASLAAAIGWWQGWF